MSDTPPVTFEVFNLEHARFGRILAFADVRLDIDGIEIIVQGFRVLRSPGALIVQPPVWRREGAWLPAIVLPKELRKAIADVVIDTLRGGSNMPDSGVPTGQGSNWQ